MQTSSDGPRSSGSRWEPAADEQATEVLTPPAAGPAPSTAAPVRRGISTTAAVLIAVLVGALGGAVAGVALTGDRGEQPVSGVVSDQGEVPGTEGRLEGSGQGRHGFDGDHDGEFR